MYVCIYAYMYEKNRQSMLEKGIEGAETNLCHAITGLDGRTWKHSGQVPAGLLFRAQGVNGHFPPSGFIDMSGTSMRQHAGATESHAFSSAVLVHTAGMALFDWQVTCGKSCMFSSFPQDLRPCLRLVAIRTLRPGLCIVYGLNRAGDGRKPPD